MARKQPIYRDFKQGNKLHHRGDIPAAAKAYQRHVNGNPKDKAGHYNFAVTLTAAHQVELAILSYCRAIQFVRYCGQVAAHGHAYSGMPSGTDFSL